MLKNYYQQSLRVLAAYPVEFVWDMSDDKKVKISNKYQAQIFLVFF